MVISSKTGNLVSYIEIFERKRVKKLRLDFLDVYSECVKFSRKKYDNMLMTRFSCYYVSPENFTHSFRVLIADSERQKVLREIVFSW
jgi:hypothetical protein